MLVLYAGSVGSAPDKPERPNETGPWSLVEPFLLVSNQLITLAEALSDFTFSTLGALGSLGSGAFEPSNPRAAASSEEEIATGNLAASPTGSTPHRPAARAARKRVRRRKPASGLTRDDLPEIPTSRRLHHLPCGNNLFFLWYRLPEVSSTHPLQLREFSASTGAETRRIELSHGATSTYLAMPPGASKHWIELGREVDGSWVAASEPCEIHAGNAPATARTGKATEIS